MSRLALDGIEIYMKANMKLEQEIIQLKARNEKLERVREAADKCIGTMGLDDLYYRIHKLELALKDCEAGE